MYRYDESDWPLFRVFAPAVAVTDAEFELHLRRLKRVFERRERHVMIIHLSPSSWLSMERRDRIRVHASDTEHLATEFQCGIGFVAYSAMQRAMINAVLWLTRPACPTAIFADAATADLWAYERLTEK